MITNRSIYLALLLGILVAVPTAQANGSRRWRERASLSVARQEVGAARIGDKAYLVGGLRGGGPGILALDSVEVYDPQTGRWSFIPAMPEGRDHLAVAAHGGKLYVLGGFRADFAARDNTWVFDPATSLWTTLAPMPEGRGGAWAAASGDRIYVFGGEDPAGQVRDTTFIYDPQTNTWSQGASMPTARQHLVAVAAGDHVYCLGGRDARSASGTPYVVNERYDPASDSWMTMAPMPTARSAMGVAAFRGRLHVAGGEAPILHDVHEVYDPQSDTWETFAPMPVPRHAMGAVALDDAILFAGGATRVGLGETDYVDEFGPRTARRFTDVLGDAGSVVIGIRLGLAALFRGRVAFCGR